MAQLLLWCAGDSVRLNVHYNHAKMMDVINVIELCLSYIVPRDIPILAPESDWNMDHTNVLDQLQQSRGDIKSRKY